MLPDRQSFSASSLCEAMLLNLLMDLGTQIVDPGRTCCGRLRPGCWHPGPVPRVLNIAWLSNTHMYGKLGPRRR